MNSGTHLSTSTAMAQHHLSNQLPSQVVEEERWELHDNNEKIDIKKTLNKMQRALVALVLGCSISTSSATVTTCAVLLNETTDGSAFDVGLACNK